MAKSKYEAQLLSWAVQQVIELHKHQHTDLSVILEQAQTLADACAAPEKEFEHLVAELSELFKVIPDPAAKAQQLVLELNHMLEDIERQQAEHEAFKAAQVKGAA